MTALLPRDRLPAGAREPEAVGLLAHDPPLRRDPFGDIDYHYYLQQARDERSKAAYALIRSIASGVSRMFSNRTATRSRHRTAQQH